MADYSGSLRYLSQVRDQTAEYRRLSRVFHPDKVPAALRGVSHQFFNRLNTGYNWASNPVAYYLFARHRTNGLKIFNTHKSYFDHILADWGPDSNDFEFFLMERAGEIEEIYQTLWIYGQTQKHSKGWARFSLKVRATGSKTRKELEASFGRSFSVGGNHLDASITFTNNLFEGAAPILGLSLARRIKVAGVPFDLGLNFNLLDPETPRASLAYHLPRGIVVVKGSIREATIDSGTFSHAISDNSNIVLELARNSDSLFWAVSVTSRYEIGNGHPLRMVYQVSSLGIKVVSKAKFRLSESTLITAQVDLGRMGLLGKDISFVAPNITLGITQEFCSFNLKSYVKTMELYPVIFGFKLVVHGVTLDVPFFFEPEISLKKILIGAILATSHRLIRKYCF